MSNVPGSDIQNTRPSTQVALSRVGVTGLKRILRLNSPRKNARTGDRVHGTLFFADVDLFADLVATQSGVHMSRFLENMEEAAGEISAEVSPDIETLAERMALSIARTQGAKRSEVRIRAQFPMTKTTPKSGVSVEDLYTFIGVAVSDGSSTRRAIGVEVSGLTVCPCAREMVAEDSRAKLLAAGYEARQAEEILSMLPLASHNQRGLGTLIVGTERPVGAEELVKIVESSMSSEIYELLKRPDELEVVRNAHMKPRFVEDVVREMIGSVVREMPELSGDTFVMARQENFESIHTHNAFAERGGLLGEMRAELAGIPQNAPTGKTDKRYRSLESWLDSLM